MVCTSELNSTWLWPPITSIIAGPPPLYGTCTMSTPAISLKSSRAQVLEAADAGRGVVELAGLLLGERDQLLTELTGTDGMHASARWRRTPSMATGTNDLTGSYLSL